MAKSIAGEYELDILVILNKGVIIKDWREKRSFVGLETKKDTMKWFFILMNEYIDIDDRRELDLRKYILQKDIIYNQY